MTKELQVYQSLAIPEFKWRAGNGSFIPVSKMDTMHLFYTLRMIWNHSMPQDAQIGKNIKRHTFSPFYTTEYMQQAVYNMYYELETRWSWLPPFAQAELELMYNYFVKKVPSNAIST